MTRLLLIGLLCISSLATAQSMNTAKTESDNLLNAAVPFAEKMLTQHGEFYPYGAALTALCLTLQSTGPSKSYAFCRPVIFNVGHHSYILPISTMSPLERAIAKKISSELKQAGFGLVAGWNAFVRKTQYGHDSLRIVNQGAAAPGPSHNEISIHCSIRHDAVEIPWNTIGLVYGEAQLETDTLVLGFPRGLAAPKFKVFTQTKDADVDRIANEGLAIFHEVALPFYSRFQDLREIESLANTRPLEDITPFTVGLAMEHRAFRSLILAKLVNPNRYAQIRATFLERNVGMFPPEKRLMMLAKVDALQLGDGVLR